MSLFRERALSLLTPSDVQTLPEARGRVLVTGIGGSEGPARVHVHVLRALGVDASFVPISGVRAAKGDELRVFSQNLSPNARLAVHEAKRFTRRVLITAQAADDPLLQRFGGTIVRHEPASEDGLLVRIAGPTMATRIALGTKPPSLHAAWERVSPIDLSGAVAYVTAGDDGERYFGLRWKHIETLGTCDPPVYDVLNFAHGPFQLWYGRPLTLIALRASDDDPALWTALRTLVRPQQRLVELTADAPRANAWHEHDAMQNALLAHALDQGVGHGERWPGFGEDSALYDLTHSSGQ